MKLFCVIFAIFCLGFPSHFVESRSLRDLPFDELLLIFEKLEIPDLLNAIESDEAVLEPAIWIFKHVHLQTEKLIVIDGSAFNIDTDITQIERDQLIIQDYEIALKLLKYFGSSITNLELNYEKLELHQIEAVNRLIDENCSQKLTKLQVTYDSNGLDGLTKAFQNVVNVTFVKSLISSKTLRLDKLFPQMRHLGLINVNSMNAEYLYHHFEHLESFTVNLCALSGWFIESKLEKMFQKNPQIKSIKMDRTSYGIVKEMSTSLSNLENLELPGLMADFFCTHSNISFSTVNKLKLSIHRSIHLSPGFIPFQFNNQLEEFELSWYQPESPRISNEWLEFIRRQSNLKKLKIKFPFFNPCMTIAYITDLNLMNLEEFTVEHVNLNINELNRFIDGRQKLAKLQELHLIAAKKTFLDEIQQHNSTDWWVNGNGNDSFDIVIKIMQ